MTTVGRPAGRPLILRFFPLTQERLARPSASLVIIHAKYQLSGAILLCARGVLVNIFRGLVTALGSLNKGHDVDDALLYVGHEGLDDLYRLGSEEH